MKRIVVVFALAALALAGLSTGVLASGEHASAKVTTVTVTATEFKFKLSRKTVPVGTVVFRIVNKGKIAHNFRIAGKTSKTIAPGKSTTLKVRFAKKGRSGYLCTLPGHAAAGMKGVLGVDVSAGTTTATTTTTTGTGEILVDMFEFRFQLSQTAVPRGTVTFVVVNKGQIQHNFTFPSLGVATPNLDPGQTARVTITFAQAGSVEYVCTLPQHAEAG